MPSRFTALPTSRKAYKKCWKEFKEINPEINFEEGRPGEEAIVWFEALSQDPVVEVEMEKDPLDTKDYIVFDEDPEMYAMAGKELVPVPAPVPAPVQERIESTIRQAMSSVPTLNGATVNVKIVVLNDPGRFK